MNIAIFSIYDSKADAYLQPFFTANKATAIRSFSDLVNDPNSHFGKHAADFVLFEIGAYDDQRGVLLSHEANINLGVGIEFQQPAEVPTLEAIR